jgi:nucleotide-binding universal stress UspA family protein
MTPRAVVVPVDSTESALAAVPIAKRFGELQGGTLHFVHVAPERALAAEVLERIGLPLPELRGSILDACVGEPAAEILETARALDAALIVMSTHTSVSAEDRILGRTALAVLQGARCPVVLVPPGCGVEPWALRRVLLPHDGTPTTSAALPPALRLAAAAEAELEVLHVAVEGAPASAEHGSLVAPRYMDQAQYEWTAWTGEFLERVGCASPLGSLKVKMLVANGAPGDEVLRVARDHADDLIVLAWRGAWESGRAAIFKAVMRRTGCPVMVMRVSE